MDLMFLFLIMNMVSLEKSIEKQSKYASLQNGKSSGQKSHSASQMHKANASENNFAIVSGEAANHIRKNKRVNCHCNCINPCFCL